MAQNLQAIKKRIRTSQSIFQIAKAMEMIAASKIRKAEIAVEGYKPYSSKVTYIVQKILADKDVSEYIPVAEVKNGKKLVFVISPDKGLCGGLVVNLLKKLVSAVSQDDYVVAVGKKAIASVVKYNFNVVATFNMGTTFPKYENIFPLKLITERLFNSKEVTKVSIIYTSFKNALIQNVVEREILPIKRDEKFVNNGIEYIMEPSSQQILADMIPYYLEVEFYNALMNAFASEQAARMTAMKNAKDNADEISASLTNIYNKSRQEKITNEILDLANGQQQGT
ncbi:MAG: ATP synthase F1 subunit gamma [Elusimicrobiota bacterium]|jgi:F-type H+-transporting ATPase subunit gamma|nr:ATP synthase F1 subunit gamma [Elusimicrobiota bacterium]